MEVSEEEEIREEEEKDDIEEIPQQVKRYGNDQVNRYNRYNDQTVNRLAPGGGNRYNQRFQDNLNRDLEKVRHGQQPEVRRQPFEEDENDDEEEEEKAEMLMNINPYAATMEQIEEAFCFDMTVLVSLALFLNFPHFWRATLSREKGREIQNSVSKKWTISDF